LAVDQDLIVVGPQDVVDALVVPESLHGFRVVDDVAQPEDSDAVGAILAEPLERGEHFALHARRGMVHDQHVRIVILKGLKDEIRAKFEHIVVGDSERACGVLFGSGLLDRR
jgi:hypothetical protein